MYRQLLSHRNNTMHTAVLYLLLLLYFLLSTTATPPYTATENILLNSGSASTTQSLDQDGRNWDSDANSKFCPSNSEMPSASSASAQDPSVTTEPYFTARIIRSEFTCIFPVSMGPKFIRLYFYPHMYSGLNPSDSFFTVTANGYTLLSNFSAYLALQSASSTLYFNKEFIVTVRDSEQINLTFTPSPNSFAFINGIEIVSIPTNLYITNMDNSYSLVGQNNFFLLDNTTSLETVARLNVGGGQVSTVNDSGMFRTWSDDSDYMGGPSGYVHLWRNDVKIKYNTATPAYVAPEVVYVTQRTMGNNSALNLNYNLTWSFSVDSGFNYLLRLHFCETEKNITKENDRVFFIYINNITAEPEADVIHWSGGRTIPVYKDYIIHVPVESHSKQDLWLALHPNIDVFPSYTDAILNGLEIFKLNNSDGSLAGSNPEAEVPPSPEQQRPRLPERKNSKGTSLILHVVAAVVGTVLAISLILLFFIYRRGKAKDGITTENKWLWLPFSRTYSSTAATALLLPTDLCRQFTMAEITAATRNFDDENVIGKGGFGTVYKGFIENGSVPVAIKRLDSWSKQGIHEFHTEIGMLSRLRHAHLVSLIGYCGDQSEMILVYEFMSRGNLQDHLYKAKKIPLPWKQRLQICIGAARGLHYLHNGAKHTIIHRDVKSSNILLDSNWAAKVSDFGLSKTGPTSESQTHISTLVKGSFGYLDPEYLRRQQLTEKSDVYSFGVVLLEVVCGRPAVMTNQPKERVNLVEWARYCRRRGTTDEIIDPELKGDMASVSFNKFMEIAEGCVGHKAIERPAMGDVLWSLEFALQLQQSADHKNVNDSDDSSKSQKVSSARHREVTTTDDDDPFTSSSASILHSISTVTRSCSNDDSDRVRSENVFSEIMNQHGR